MATRFYLPSTGTIDVIPSFGAGWTTTGAIRLPCFPFKKGTAMTTLSFADANNANLDALLIQYISPCMEAQTLSSQSIALQIRALERIANNNLFTSLMVRVVSEDGTVVRGTPLALTRDTLETTTTLVNRRLLVASSIQVVAQEGDRLVIEIGAGGDPANTGGADHDFSFRVGDAAASDLAADDASTLDNNPYVEFGGNITFRSILTLRTHSGYKYFNVFSLNAGGQQENECTQSEYIALGQPNNINPTIANAVWKYSYERLAFSTGNSLLANDEYGNVENRYFYVKRTGYRGMSVPLTMVNAHGQLTSAGKTIVENPLNSE
jgi:hypothetical protein